MHRFERSEKRSGELLMDVGNFVFSSRKVPNVINVARVEKIRSESLQLRSAWRPFGSSFERKGALVTVEICVLYGR